MAEDSFTIDLPPDSNISSVALFAEVLDARGEPLSGAFVTFRLQGEGSFDDISNVHTQQRRCSKQGVSTTWYEYPVQKPRQALKGTVTASCLEATSVKLRPGTLIPFYRSEPARIGSTTPSQATVSPAEDETNSVEEEAVVDIHSEASTEGLSKPERSALFAMLSGGTTKHLGRAPTTSEFIRLCDAVIFARKLSTIESGVLSEESEIYWTGDNWVIITLDAHGSRAA